MTWKEELLAIIQNIKPEAFERLCQRLLREAGFESVEVTQRSGDGVLMFMNYLELEKSCLLKFYFKVKDILEI